MDYIFLEIFIAILIFLALFFCIRRLLLGSWFSDPDVVIENGFPSSNNRDNDHADALAAALYASQYYHPERKTSSFRWRI